MLFRLKIKRINGFSRHNLATAFPVSRYVNARKNFAGKICGKAVDFISAYCYNNYRKSAVFVVWEIRNPQSKFGSGPFAEICKVCILYGKPEVSLRRTHLGDPGLILFHITAQADEKKQVHKNAGQAVLGIFREIDGPSRAARGDVAAALGHRSGYDLPLLISQGRARHFITQWLSIVRAAAR